MHLYKIEQNHIRQDIEQGRDFWSRMAGGDPRFLISHAAEFSLQALNAYMPEKALETIEKIIGHAEQYPALYGHKARVLIENGRAKEAIPFFEKALGLAPETLPNFSMDVEMLNSKPIENIVTVMQEDETLAATYVAFVHSRVRELGRQSFYLQLQGATHLLLHQPEEAWARLTAAIDTNEHYLRFAARRDVVDDLQEMILQGKDISVAGLMNQATVSEDYYRRSLQESRAYRAIALIELYNDTQNASHLQKARKEADKLSVSMPEPCQLYAARMIQHYAVGAVLAEEENSHGGEQLEKALEVFAEARAQDEESSRHRSIGLPHTDLRLPFIHAATPEMWRIAVRAEEALGEKPLLRAEAVDLGIQLYMPTDYSASSV